MTYYGYAVSYSSRITKPVLLIMSVQTISNFKEMANAIDAIYMVEASPELRVTQKNLLCGQDRQMTESKSGYHSTCKYSDLPIVWTETVRSIPQGKGPKRWETPLWHVYRADPRQVRTRSPSS
jgi:hypothetical protein